MTKTLKKYKVNVKVEVNFPIYVIAKDEDEAIEKCEESITESDFKTYIDTIGLDVPNDTFDDDFETSVFDMEYYEIELWGSPEFSIDDYESPKEVELEYGEDEEDDDEEDDE